MNTDLTAIVLAAGGGKRMVSLGADLPKIMLPVLGKPVLTYIFDNLLEAGINKIILITSPKSEQQVRDFFGKSYRAAKITYIQQDRQLGPAHAIRLALQKVRTQYLLVQYGDSISDTNIVKGLIKVLGKNPQADGVIAVREVDDPTRYGIVNYEKDRVKNIIEKPKENPPSNHAVIGSFILKSTLYKEATKNIWFEYDKEEFPAQYVLRHGANIITRKFTGKRVDVGKPQDLFNASQLLTKVPVKCIVFDADNTLYKTMESAKEADMEAMEVLSKKVSVEPEILYERWLQLVKMLNNSTDPQIRSRKYSYSFLASKYKTSGKIIEEMFDAFKEKLLEKIQIAKGIKNILENLKQKKIIVTEDSQELVSAKLKKLELLNFFSKIITSDDTKTMKPSKKYYEEIFNRFQPSEVLVVGDNYKNDLQIPANLGARILFVEKEESLEILKTLIIPKKIHIMGAAGAGASAVAGIAVAFGFEVDGCDLSPKSAYSQNLKIIIKKDHDKNHLKNIDMLIVSPAISKFDPNNMEVKTAQQKKIPVKTWQEFQGQYLQKDKFVIAVAGAYGKSTTTAMISQILIDAGSDPTCEVGAKVLEWQSNFRIGKSKYYVCEADEYNNNFLNYRPDIAVILNTSWDHPDFFKSEEEALDAFRNFVSNIKSGGILVIPRELEKFSESADKGIKIAKIESEDINLSIIGEFRKQNANAASAVAKLLKIDPNLTHKSLSNFKGLARRLEFKGKIKNVLVYDDYAVQPVTLFATTNALKEKFKDKKLTLVFEPHTFSRIQAFYKDFVNALKNCQADKILITEVYQAREKGNPEELPKKIARDIPSKTIFTGSIEKTTKYIKENLNDFDIILSIGAGNSYKLFDLLKK